MLPGPEPQIGLSSFRAFKGFGKAAFQLLHILHLGDLILP
ncbi:hypothetical protein Y017_08330 [Alcanivorax sp. 97CO-5]|nr:hypothetical protein Y017_08330 [Alcanivorax sp. 97CO-5]